MHGFDPHSADMHPIFFARGPDFANKREEQEPFTNLDLYPLCCFLLGVEPAPNNGSLAELHAYLGNQNFNPLKFRFMFSFITIFSAPTGPCSTYRDGRALFLLHPFGDRVRHLPAVLEVEAAHPPPRPRPIKYSISRAQLKN